MKHNSERSKLDHLADMAKDDRMQYSIWNLERIFGVAAQGFFFTSLGAIFTYDSLSDNFKTFAIVGLLVGGFFGFYCLFKEFKEAKEREKFKTKIVTKLDELIAQMNSKKNETQ
jgi:hypothetical protein